MKETSSSWKSWGAVVGVAIGLSGLAATWIAWQTCSPAQPAPSATAGASGSASHVEGGHPLLLDPADNEVVGEDLVVSGLVDATARDDEAAVNAELSPGAAMEPRLKADVRPAPPPEAFLPAQPRALSPNRDTGLVFRNEPPGDGAMGEAKEGKPSGAQEPSNSSNHPAFTADLRPPVDPGSLAPKPTVAPPNRDTGLVFSNQPLQPADSGDEKH